MSAKEMMENVGKEASVEMSKGFHVNVGIEDARQVFNRVDYKVRPLNGVGFAWVEASRVRGLR